MVFPNFQIKFLEIETISESGGLTDRLVHFALNYFLFSDILSLHYVDRIIGLHCNVAYIYMCSTKKDKVVIPVLFKIPLKKKNKKKTGHKDLSG